MTTTNSDPAPTPPLPTIPQDWTCDDNGLSNSSPKFHEVMAHIQDLINSNTHHVLRPEHVAALARVIASQIAHIDHLAPIGDDQQALRDANEAFARRERAMADLLRSNGFSVDVENGIPVGLFGPYAQPAQVQELQDIDHLLARRSALDDLPTRNQKILHAIERAAEADRLERQWREALDSEHKISDAYVRIREIVGAMDTPRAPNFEQITALTERRAKHLVAQLRNISVIINEEVH